MRPTGRPGHGGHARRRLDRADRTARHDRGVHHHPARGAAARRRQPRRALRQGPADRAGTGAADRGVPCPGGPARRADLAGRDQPGRAAARSADRNRVPPAGGPAARHRAPAADRADARQRRHPAAQARRGRGRRSRPGHGRPVQAGDAPTRSPAARPVSADAGARRRGCWPSSAAATTRRRQPSSVPSTTHPPGPLRPPNAASWPGSAPAAVHRPARWPSAGRRARRRTGGSRVRGYRRPGRLHGDPRPGDRRGRLATRSAGSWPTCCSSTAARPCWTARRMGSPIRGHTRTPVTSTWPTKRQAVHRKTAWLSRESRYGREARPQHLDQARPAGERSRSPVGAGGPAVPRSPLSPSCGGIPASRNAAAPYPWQSMHMPLRCLLVDDSDAFLEAASVLLEREGLTVVGMASSIRRGAPAGPRAAAGCHPRRHRARRRERL